jgi:hypothetical protein
MSLSIVVIFPGTILNSWPISDRIAIKGTKKNQLIFCWLILFFQIISIREMYEKTQRPLGSEYKSQLGKLSASASVMALRCAIGTSKDAIANHLNMVKLSVRNEM